MTHRILITGRNNTVPACAFTGLPTRQASPHSGVTPESDAGGTRDPSSLPPAPSAVLPPEPLGATITAAFLYCALFFGAGFGLAWTF